ncbi:uncharacterized protein MONBRDRAFT_37661 [Monosiga brevicollis MX1]|uniref:Longin domain-containing protein n=1 Tax=Monosiga brevicollis TaxID=81824 RepID=A9V346_MONBE|nr:uncharacterized protein MONBRDRAFT_37661 [Monosiga brevicollis MX1]EDQ87997.1 predicted protein [Monosiga brevicollis MX1]|eukprot:XP_001747073.1 hypothetical protein [Monosiga brevicollis MX1]
MIHQAIIARVIDGLPLAASMDDNDENFAIYKQQAKTLFKKLNASSTPRCTVNLSDRLVFHYTIEAGVCYLVLCDKTFSKKLAFGYLEELQREFSEMYGNRIDTAARPYAFIEFDGRMQKLKRAYEDSRATNRLDKINAELMDVQRIMVKNIDEVFERGEQLNSEEHKRAQREAHHQRQDLMMAAQSLQHLNAEVSDDHLAGRWRNASQAEWHMIFESRFAFRAYKLEYVLHGGSIAFVGDSISSQIYDAIRQRAVREKFGSFTPGLLAAWPSLLHIELIRRGRQWRSNLQSMKCPRPALQPVISILHAVFFFAHQARGYPQRRVRYVLFAHRDGQTTTQAARAEDIATQAMPLQGFTKEHIVVCFI